MPPSLAHGSGPHVSRDELRGAVGHFATGVAVVTSRTADGAPAGTTVSAIASVSLDPPLVLVCLDRASLTLAALRAHGALAVNVLATRQQELSSAFARRGAMDAWEGVAHRAGRTGSPRLADALATLDCAVEQIVPGGDHEIVIGRVLEIETNRPAEAPLLHYRGRYASLAPA